MKLKMSTLENSALARFFFGFIRRCQIVLDTGTTVEFNRGSGMYATSIHCKESLTRAEEEQTKKLAEM